jgi:hypothetical protein
VRVADPFQVVAAVDGGEGVVPGDVDLDLHAIGQAGCQVRGERSSPLGRRPVGLPLGIGRNDRQGVVAHGLTQFVGHKHRRGAAIVGPRAG